MLEGSKGNTEVSGRHLGASPDTCRVAIGETALGQLAQTKWLAAGIHHGPHQPSLKTGSWWKSCGTYGVEFARFLKRHADADFLEPLIKELQDE